MLHCDVPTGGGGGPATRRRSGRHAVVAPKGSVASAENVPTEDLAGGDGGGADSAAERTTERRSRRQRSAVQRYQPVLRPQQPPRSSRSSRDGQSSSEDDLSEDGSDGSEDTTESEEEEDASEEESDDDDNRRRSRRQRTSVQRYQPELRGVSGFADPLQRVQRLSDRLPARQARGRSSRINRGAAAAGSGRSDNHQHRFTSRRPKVGSGRPKRSLRRVDSDSSDDSSKRRRRRRRERSTSPNSEEEFEQRRIDSLSRQRANVRPINLQHLPRSAEGEANNCGADALGGQNTAKLGKIDVEPLQFDTNISWDDVGGLGPVLQSLKEMVSLPLLYPEVYERFGISPPRGVLFYGPPGTGKTLVAKALAASVSQGGQKVAFFMRNGADCLSKWVGEAERQLRVTFEQAYLYQPSIIFFDEVDGLAPVRSSKQDQIHSSVVSTLLGLMDGLQSRGKIVVIGATNRIDSIDPALRRPGRFDREFLFPMPNVAARRCILDIHTQKWSPHPDDNLLNELAAACTGYCGADIKALCTEAALHAVQRAYPQIWQSDQKLLINHESIVVTRTDFMRAKKKVVPSLLRSSTSYGKPLLGLLKPILSPVVTETVRALQSAFFPFCESVASFRSAGETEFDDIQLDTAGRPPPAWSCVHIHGPADCGQADIAVAVLRHFDQVPCQGLDLPALIANNNSRSLEEAAVTTARQAGQMTPSILYLPHFQVLMRTAYEGVRTALWCALERLPSSVLLLVTSDVPLERLPPGAEPFLAHHGVGQSFEVKVDPPKDDARRVAFTESFNALNTFVAIPVDTSGTLPVLPVAPIVHDPCADALKEAQLMYNAEKYVSAAKVLRSALAYHDKDASLAQALKIAEANIKNQRDHARKVLLDLRFEIRDILESIEKQRRFKMFMHPVDPDIAPDYYALVETPVDVEMIRAKNDDGHYSDTQSFFADIEMILRNAKAYNSSSSEQGAEIIARAHAFVDFVERRLDNSDAVKLAKEYHRLQECGVGLASAHEPSIDRGQFHNARSGRGDDRQRPVRRPYQAPGGARASRRVAGAAPEVVLSFAEMGTKPEVLANQGTSDSLDVEHNKDAARETVLQHGRVQDIATQSQAVDRPTSSSVDATVAMSDQASIDNASVLGDHAADVEWVAPGQVVQDLTERFTTNSCGLNLKQLLHICARVSSVVWKHRHSTDKRSAVQELELICKELGKIVQTTHNQ